MAHSPTAQRYNPAIVVLHWLIAILVVVVYGLTYVWDSVPDEDVPFIKDLHMGLGFTVLVLVIARIVIRLSTASPPAAQSGWPFLDRIGSLAHVLLYVLLLAVTILGVSYVQSRARGIPLGFMEIPALLTDPVARDTSRAIREVHELAANALIALAIVHALAALFHQFVLRDRLMRRMTLGGR